MACEDADTLDAAVLTAAASPRRVKTDTTEVEAHPLGDLIKAADRARALCATQNRSGGPKYRKISPGSAD